MTDDNTRYMQSALREAERAYDEGEVPVGCVIVLNGEIIGKAHNQRETLQDPTAHAEVLAITQAAAHLKSWRLEGARLYVTLEPCAMCAGAIILARLDEVINMGTFRHRPELVAPADGKRRVVFLKHGIFRSAPHFFQHEGPRRVLDTHPSCSSSLRVENPTTDSGI